MSKDKTRVVERLRAKITDENRIFVRKNLAISEQVLCLLKEKGWTQKQLAHRLGKNESEVSKLLSGLHNLTLMSIAKLEAELGSDIITTPLEACEKYKIREYVTLYVSMHQSTMSFVDCFEEGQTTEYPNTYQKMAV